MTREFKTVIDLDDIIGLDLECLACHSRLTIPLAKYDRNLYQCPQCNAPWVLGCGSNTDHVIRNMVGCLREVAQMPSKDVPVGMRIRFQLSPEPPEVTSASGRASGGKDS